MSVLGSVCTFYYKTSTVWTPSKFATPLVPWIPSLGLLANTFLIGSLGVAAYIRFAVWFVIGLLIYVFYGAKHSVIGKKLTNDLHGQELATILEDEDDDGPEFGVKASLIVNDSL